MASRAKENLGGSKGPKPMGTPVAEYIESKVPRDCGHCEYFQKPGLCGQQVMMTDPKVKTDKKTGLKIVDAVLGCCRYWKPEEDKD